MSAACMPADARPGGRPEPNSAALAMQQLNGRVELRLVSRGSKSEHQATVLVDDQGVAHRLRRRGGPPFADSVLAGLQGQRVALVGHAHEHFFLVDRWQLL